MVPRVLIYLIDHRTTYPGSQAILLSYLTSPTRLTIILCHLRYLTLSYYIFYFSTTYPVKHCPNLRVTSTSSSNSECLSPWLCLLPTYQFHPGTASFQDQDREVCVPGRQMRHVPANAKGMNNTPASVTMWLADQSLLSCSHLPSPNLK